MKRKMSVDLAIRLCVVTTVALIALTRALTLTHNMTLHPDEYVYYYSTKNMVNFLQGERSDYAPIKDYPEGAFVFQMPFQLLFRLFSMKDELSLRLSGRVASVFYFSVGAVLGFAALSRLFGKSLRASMIYGLTMAFSLFHTEQSRYGTSESLILLFLMLALYMCAGVYEHRTRPRLRLFFAGLSCGILAAMKYPLLYFILLPVIAAVRHSPRRADTIVAVELVVLSAAVGFFLVSPKTLTDIGYIGRCISGEWSSYMNAGNVTEVGGWLNHLLAVLIYMTAYAGLFGGPLLAWPLLKRYREPGQDSLRLLRRVDLPLVTFGFFAYNVFTKTIFMRTFYPLAAVIDLYACAGLSALLEAPVGRRNKALAAAVLAVTVLRGGFFIGALTENTATSALQAAIASGVDGDWHRTTILGPARNYLLPIDRSVLTNPGETDLDGEGFRTPESLIVQPGELVITAALEDSKCAPYLLPVANELANLRINRWHRFKTINADYFHCQAYPPAYYALFGYWIKGTTGTDYEFPTNRLYYRPADPYAVTAP